MVNAMGARKQRLAARWLPINGESEEFTDLGAIVWRYVSNGKPAACGFKGYAITPVFNTPFVDDAQRESFIAKWIKELQEAATYRMAVQAQYKLQVLQFFADLSEGSLFYYTDGYEQTNAHFFQVVGKVTAANVVVRPIAHTKVERAPLAMCGHALPCKDEFTGDERIFKVSDQIPHIWKEGDRVRISWYG